MLKILRKKAVVVFFCLALVFGLAACGGGGTGSGDTGSSGGGTEIPANKSEILIGYAAPLTGPLSIFMGPTDWCEKLCLEVINEQNGGIYVKELDKKLPVRVIYADTESDPTKASEAASKLVLDDKVDILVGGWTPVGTNPVSAVGERYEVPTFVFGCPKESWLEAGPYEWSAGALFVYDLLMTDVINTWNELDTNKKVGFVFDSDVDGITGTETVTRMLDGTDYQIFDPGRFTIGTSDYTSMINFFKDNDCEILIADMITPDFFLFWEQCHQLGYVPQVMTINKGMHYANDAAALQNGTGNGLTFSALWDKNFPFNSELLGGISTLDLANNWEDEHGEHYPYSIGNDVLMFEILYDALTRAESLDKATIRDAIYATDLKDTVFGEIKFDAEHVAELPAITTQWLPGTKWPFEKTIVSSETFPVIPSHPPVLIPR